MTSQKEEDTDIFQETVTDPKRPAVPDRTVDPDGNVARDETANLYTVGIKCPNHVLGLLCGREQREIKELIKKYPGLEFELQKGPRLTREEINKATFDTWLSNRLTTVVLAHENQEVVENVKAEVGKRIKDLARTAPYTHFVSLPLIPGKNPELTKKVEEWRQEVLGRETNQKDAIDESIVVLPSRLHFTLLMLRIYDSETLEAIDRVLKKLVVVVKERNVASFPLSISLKGLCLFENERPERASIVYAHCGVAAMSLTSKDGEGPDVDTPPMQAEVRRNTLLDLDSLSRSTPAFQNRLIRTVKALEETTADKNQLAILKAAADRCTETEAAVKALIGQVRGNTARTSRSNRDTSSVEGPEASRLFVLFELLVQLMTDEGLLDEEGKRERRIFGVEGSTTPGQLDKRSLVLHVTMINNKWRSTAMTRNLTSGRQNARRPLRTRRFNIPFNASAIIDPKYDFGKGIIDELHLSRRGVPEDGELYFAEKTYSLAP